MEELKNTEPLKVVEKVEAIEIEKDPLFRGFVMKMEGLIKSYDWHKNVCGRRNSLSGRRMPKIWREQDISKNGQNMEKRREEMQTVVSDMVPFVYQEIRQQFIDFLRNHQFTIGYTFVDMIVDNLK